MRKINNIKAFTLLELMVSIFITILVIASFYKLYDASTKTERAASVRVSVNLMAEQMADTIADAIKMIALNSGKSDHSANKIIQSSTNSVFTFSSPYGSPVTKIISATESYPTCKFTIYNSASIHNSIRSLNLHTQYGVFVTTKNTSGYTPTYSGTTASFTVSGFATTPVEQVYNPSTKSSVNLSDKPLCSVVFPAGTLITGEDSDFTLSYTTANNSQALTLKSRPKGETTGSEAEIVNFQGGKDDAYSMPKFTIQYLKEYKGTDNNYTREWVDGVTEVSERSQIKAVRFGFIIVSNKDRVTPASETPAGDVNKYCIFTSSDCYELTDPNKTVSVFRRVVDLVNYRLLEENL